MAINVGSVTVSSQTVSSPIILQLPSPFPALGLMCTVSPGANLTYEVDVTGDNPPNNNIGSNWNAHDVLVGKTASANGNIAYPVTGVRLNVTSYSSGSVTLAVVR